MNKQDVKRNFQSLFSINKDFNAAEFDNILDILSEQIADNPNSQYNYIANISQSGTAAPYVISTGTNTFPVDPIYSYSAVGQYIVTFPTSLSLRTNGYFSGGITVGTTGNQTGFYFMNAQSSSSVKIFTYNLTAGPANNLLSNNTINIQQIGTDDIIVPFNVTQIATGHSYGKTESVKFGKFHGGTSGLDYSLGERDLGSLVYGKIQARMLSVSGESILGSGSPIDYRAITLSSSQANYIIYAHSSNYGINEIGREDQLSFDFTLPNGITSILITDVETSGTRFSQLYTSTSTLTGTIPYNVNKLNAKVTF